HHHLTPHTYTLSLHDALPISRKGIRRSLALNGDDFKIGEAIQDFAELAIEKNRAAIDDNDAAAKRLNIGHIVAGEKNRGFADGRSEEHTSELQSRFDLVCRLL